MRRVPSALVLVHFFIASSCTVGGLSNTAYPALNAKLEEKAAQVIELKYAIEEAFENAVSNELTS